MVRDDGDGDYDHDDDDSSNRSTQFNSTRLGDSNARIAIDLLAEPTDRPVSRSDRAIH